MLVRAYLVLGLSLVRPADGPEIRIEVHAVGHAGLRPASAAPSCRGSAAAEDSLSMRDAIEHASVTSRNVNEALTRHLVHPMQRSSHIPLPDDASVLQSTRR